MPNWQPNWDDVEFDQARAQAAADECRLAAGALENVIDGLDGAHTALASDAAWTGVYRDDYDGEQPAVADEAISARAALVVLAAAIEGAAGAAAAEQVRREADRERWRAERDREIASEEAGRRPGGRIPV